jgi:diadenosine tetraphosphate (Ap4A) HIT family hydrolase
MLERLWAGWRTAYVQSAAADDVEAPGGSIFARILASGRPDTETHIVWRGDTCFAILNAFPYTNGHTLVMPYREVGDLSLMTTEETAELWHGVTQCVAALQAAYQPEGVNVGMNLGRAAGAGVPGHLHVHVLPRWNGDTNFMTAVAEVRVLPESLPSSAARVRAAWPAPATQP